MGATQSHEPSSGSATVVVLLATHNGMEYLEPQVHSILGQRGVAVRIIASDDASTDGTYEYLQALAAHEPRITVLPQVAFQSSPRNFFHLLQQVQLADGELVALSDQDDIWQLDKLAIQLAVMRAGACDAVSSNVTAFSADGERVLIRKAYPQRRYDFVLESPGPGSTFLISPRLVSAVAEATQDPTGAAASVDYHDWLIYALARSRGWRWQIVDRSLVDYRQHGSNVMGANSGIRAVRSRLGMMRQRWHRAQAALILRAVIPQARPDMRTGLESLAALVARTDVASRLRLAARAGQLRRRPRDRVAIGLLIAAGLW